MGFYDTFHLREECEPFRDELYKSGGFFYGENMLSRVLPFTLLRLCIFSLISRTLYRFLKPLRQTEFVCNMLTGILLGPSALGMYGDYARIKDYAPNLLFQNFATCVGLIYHFFILGVKHDAYMMIRTCKKKVWIIGICTFIFPLLTLMFLMFLNKPDSLETKLSNFITCLNLAATSFINMAPVLDEFNLLTTTLGQVSLSASIVNEVVLWGFVVLGVLARSNKIGLYTCLFPATMIVAFTICFLQPAMQWVVKKMSNGQKGNQIYIVSILLWAAIMGVVSDYVVGFSLMGAALFGLVVPKGPPLGSAIANKCEMFIKHCFLPFFYMSVGDIININGLRDNSEGHLTLQFKIFIGYLIKVLATALPAIAYKMSPKQAFALGLVLNSSGDGHCIMIGYRLKLMGQTSLASQLLLSGIVVTMLVTPFTHCFHQHPTRFNLSSTRKLPLPTSMRSTMHILACVSDKNEVPGIITLLNASNPTKSSPVHVHMVHLTEHVGHTSPTLLSHKKHRNECKHNGCVDIVDTLDQYRGDHDDDNFVVQLFTMIAASKNMHDGICMLANDRRIPPISLIIVPFLYKSPDHRGQQIIPNDINRKIQVQAPCTVGIFVDRGIGNDKQQVEQCFSCRIAVIFFGGEDDREALAYAIRMLGHPGVSITVLRIHVHTFHDVTNQDEKQFDEQLMDLFKSKMFNITSENLHEIHVKDWFDAVQVIQSINNGYDLVMVGRRHGETSVQESEMSVLSENPELGYIGDMLVSTDFRQETVSVLVMQYQNMDHDKDSLGSLMFLEDDE